MDKFLFGLYDGEILTVEAQSNVRIYELIEKFYDILKSDNIEQELDKSINQVKKIATLRLNEIIHE